MSSSSSSSSGRRRPSRRSGTAEAKGTMGDLQLTTQVQEWISKALQDSTRKSRKIVESEATSLAKNESNRKQFQFGRIGGYRVLNFAARNGHKYLFDLLLEKLGVDPNLKDSIYGSTPLHHAAAAGHIQMIETLIQKYVCDIDPQDKCGSTPLCFAIGNGQNASLQKLLQYGASIKADSFLGSPMLIAIYQGNIEAVDMLYKQNPNAVNDEMYGFCTPLVAAAVYPSTECFKYLVQVADVHAQALMYKVICCADSEEKALERIRILLNHEVDPNQSYDTVTLFEDRPIFCAAKRGWRNVVEALLESTDEVPGIEWTAEGVIQYVNSEPYIELTGTFFKDSRLLHLKPKVIEEIKDNRCLAADLICKVLYLDMDREEWERYQSLCTISILYGWKSVNAGGNAYTIEYLGFHQEKEVDYEILLLSYKACLALQPDNEKFQRQLADVMANLAAQHED